MIEILLALPWLLFAIAAPFMFGRRPRIDEHSLAPDVARPLVSIIVPARNEAENIGACAASLLASRYPNREIIIVDDGSTDGTAEITRVLAQQSNGALRVVGGEPLPDGWLGKCWACWQGYQAARGELLVFTDADTRHEPDLVGHTVAALRASGAHLVSIVPRQLMESFWERVILPHVFATMRIRWPDMRLINRTRDPRYAMANGQYILMSRSVYDAIGGHKAVRRDVVEDMRLAQLIVASGRRLYLAHAEDHMSTRMYRSFREIIEGWVKNLATGSRLTAPGWFRPIFPWLIALGSLAMWVLPPLVYLTSLITPTSEVLVHWSTIAVAASLIFWFVAYRRLRVPIQYLLAYPVGGVMNAFIFLRSAFRGARVRWKGRSYTIPGR
jgi:chlorobactene glucosyltransferase